MSTDAKAVMQQQITELYVALLNRAPERDGLGYWVSELEHGRSLTAIANEMYMVPSVRNIYPSFLSQREFINALYMNVLGRPADITGEDYWVKQLAATSPGEVVVKLFGAVLSYAGNDPAGLTSQSLFENKISAGLDYAVDNLGNDATVATQINALVIADPPGTPKGSGAHVIIPSAPTPSSQGTSEASPMMVKPTAHQAGSSTAVAHTIKGHVHMGGAETHVMHAVGDSVSTTSLAGADLSMAQGTDLAIKLMGMAEHGPGMDAWGMVAHL